MSDRLRAHPAADIFPRMTGEEFAGLVDDIRRCGLRDPIELFDGGGEWLILDGRHRHDACAEAGVSIRTVVVRPDDPVAYVISKNLHRRHLGTSQKAMIAADTEKVYAAEARKRQRGGQGGKLLPANLPEATSRDREARTQAAKALNVSPRAVQQAKVVLAKGAPELVSAVRRGDVSVSAAAEVARLPEDEQRATVAAGKKAVAERAKVEREKASTPAVEWDLEEFLSGVRMQVIEWRDEVRAHEGSLRELLTSLRLEVGLMEKEVFGE